MPQSKDNTDDNSTFWGVYAGAGAAVLLFVIPVVIGTAKNAKAKRERIAAEISSAEAVQRQIDSEEELRRNPPKPRGKPKREPIDTSRIGYSTPAKFTMSSDGHTWNAAPDSAKQQLCQGLSNHSRHGNTPSFFYEAFNTFYRSNDSRILGTSIDDLTQMTESSSVTTAKEIDGLIDSALQRRRK